MESTTQAGLIDLPIITVKQPWASLIITGYRGLFKDIENRTWAPPSQFIGNRIGIHSSARLERAEMEAALDVLDYALLRDEADKARSGVAATYNWLLQDDPEIDRASLPLGAILGTVELADFVQEHDSPWFFGPVGWVLRDPVAFEKPIPAKGTLGFWRMK